MSFIKIYYSLTLIFLISNCLCIELENAAESKYNSESWFGTVTSGVANLISWNWYGDSTPRLNDEIDENQDGNVKINEKNIQLVPLSNFIEQINDEFPLNKETDENLDENLKNSEENIEVISFSSFVQLLNDEITSKGSTISNQISNIYKTVQKAISNNKLYSSITLGSKNLLVYLGVLGSDERTKCVSDFDNIINFFVNLLKWLFFWIPGYTEEESKLVTSEQNIMSSSAVGKNDLASQVTKDGTISHSKSNADMINLNDKAATTSMQNSMMLASLPLKSSTGKMNLSKKVVQHPTMMAESSSRKSSLGNTQQSTMTADSSFTDIDEKITDVNSVNPQILVRSSYKKLLTKLNEGEPNVNIKDEFLKFVGNYNAIMEQWKPISPESVEEKNRFNENMQSQIKEFMHKYNESGKKFKSVTLESIEDKGEKTELKNDKAPVVNVS